MFGQPTNKGAMFISKSFMLCCQVKTNQFLLVKINVLAIFTINRITIFFQLFCVLNNFAGHEMSYYYQTNTRKICQQMNCQRVEQFYDAENGIEIFDRGGLQYTGFSGRKNRCDFNLFFRSLDCAVAYMKKWFDETHDDMEKRKRKENRLTVGDILCCSWGYEQTNIDFYEVVALRGKITVVLREIKKEITRFENEMAGKCKPLPGRFSGEEFSRRVTSDGEGVCINDYRIASLLNPIGRDALTGERIFKEQAWTSYA